MNATALLGKRVELEGEKGPLKTCRECGSVLGKVSPGKGPHVASVRCDGCGNFLGWLSQRAVKQMEREAVDA
jgi:hypothetical protein